MTDSDDPTDPMRPSALHAGNAPLSQDDAERYANVITRAPYDPNHAGLYQLAWAHVRLVEHYKRAMQRVEALKISPEDLETITAAVGSRKFAAEYPHTTEALVRILTAQRED